jgi:hypothetical protein
MELTLCQGTDPYHMTCQSQSFPIDSIDSKDSKDSNALMMKKNNDKVSGILHSIFALFLAFYVFVFPKTKFDFWYLVIFFVLVIHWIYLKGECFVSYLHKKKNNPNYQAGEGVFEHGDMATVYGEWYKILMPWGLFLYGLSVFLVFRRNVECYPSWVKFVAVTTYFVYLWTLTSSSKISKISKISKMSKMSNHAIQEICKFILIFMFGMTITLFFYRPLVIMNHNNVLLYPKGQNQQNQQNQQQEMAKKVKQNK